MEENAADKKVNLNMDSLKTAGTDS